MQFFYNSCRILFLILVERGVMRHFRFIICSPLLAVCLLFFACSSESTTNAPNPRTITVTITNLDAINAVHIYFSGGDPSEENLVHPEESIITMVLANRLGHMVTVYVTQDKPGSLPFYSLSIRISQTSWDSGKAELHWTGSQIVPVGW
jgi:hypothetical protein